MSHYKKIVQSEVNIIYQGKFMLALLFVELILFHDHYIFN